MANGNILERIANPNVGDPSMFARGATAGNALRDITRKTEAQALTPAAVAGDKNALAKLSGLDFDTFSTLDNRNYQRGRDATSDARAAAADQRARHAEIVDRTAALLYDATDPQKFEAVKQHLAQGGVDVSKLTFENRQSYIDEAMTLSEKIKQGADVAKLAADAAQPKSDVGKRQADVSSGLITQDQADAGNPAGNSLFAGDGQNLPMVTTRPDGTPDPQSQSAFLATLPPEVASTMKAAGEYRLDPTKVFSLRGNARENFIKAMTLYDPTFNMQLYPARQKFMNDLGAGALGKGITSMNKVISHLDDLAANSVKLNNTSIPILNAVINPLRSGAGGNQDVTNYNTNADNVAIELDKAMKGTGSADVAGIEHARGNFSTNNSPEQQRGAINVVIKLLAGQIEAARDQYTRTMGKPPPAGFLSEKSRKILTKLGVDPDEIDGPVSVEGAAAADAPGGGAQPPAGAPPGTRQGLDDQGKPGWFAPNPAGGGGFVQVLP